MLRFLHQNGAKLDFVVEGEEAKELEERIRLHAGYGRPQADYDDYLDQYLPLWNGTALEYAIKTGATSINMDAYYFDAPSDEKNRRGNY